MREREQAHVRLPRCLGSLERRRVRRLASALALFVEEGRLMHEHLCPTRGFDNRRRRGRVAAEDDLPALPWRAEHLVRRDDPPVRELHRLARLQQAALGP